MLRLLISIPLALLLYVASASAQHAAHHQPMSVTDLPQAAGQAAFAAIQEIVALLENDPATDWVRVDIAALREHLVDMHRLTLQAQVTARPLADGAEFVIGGEDAVVAAAQRMVPAHAEELDKKPGWSAVAERQPDGIRLTVSSQDPSTAAKIRGLGFFGLLTLGAHHQVHHLAIAKGAAMH